MSLKDLRAKRAKLVAEMRDIITKAETENRDLAAEEITAYDALKAENDGLNDRITRAEEVEDQEASLAEIVPAHSRRAGIERPRGAEASKEFENIGEFMHAVRFRPNDQRLNYVEGIGAVGDDGELSAEMRMDTDGQGGFMVPPQLRQTIMSVPVQDALVRPRANVIEAGTPPDSPIIMPALDQSGNAPGNMFGGMTFSWIGEGDSKPDTSATLRDITLTPHEIAGTTVITDKLLRNWQAASAFLEALMRSAVTAAEDYNFLQGNGAHKPLGVINAGATYFLNRAVSNQISYLDLVGMVARLLMRSGANSPVWSMPQSAFTQIATLQDPLGRYIWQANAVNGMAGTLLGYPVRWNNRAPGLGSKGDVILADWSYYLVKDGSGPFVAASEHVLFQQNKTMMKIFWNVDGSPWLTAPIQEENGYQVSPFVALDVPA
jgi:HK97 family phage major capsid protein